MTWAAIFSLACFTERVIPWVWESAPTALGSLAGMTIGSVCGYFGGKVDYLVMRFLDIVQAIPGHAARHRGSGGTGHRIY